MKKYLLAALTASLFALPLSASIRPAPGQFGLKGEWIYFCPGIDDTYFTIPSESSNGIQGEKLNNLMPYESGYRLEGVYSFCNCINDLRVRWTQLLKHSHSIDSPGTIDHPVIMVEQPPDGLENSLALESRSELSMEYYAAEALLGQLIYDCTPFTIDLELGIQYAHFKLSENVNYNGVLLSPVNSTLLTFEDTFNGIGPELAFDADYTLYNSGCFCPGTLYLTSALRGALLIADSKAKFSNPISFGNTFYLAEDKSVWRVIPWCDMKLGFNYTSCFDCFTLSIEAGYEAGSYFNAISKERFASTFASPGFSFNHFQNFTYHGPYVAVEVMF